MNEYLYQDKISEQSDEDIMTPNQNNRSQISSESRGYDSKSSIHFTNVEAKEFWERYFESCDKVGLESFCDAVQAEFSIAVIKPCLDKFP